MVMMMDANRCTHGSVSYPAAIYTVLVEIVNGLVTENPPVKFTPKSPEVNIPADFEDCRRQGAVKQLIVNTLV